MRERESVRMIGGRGRGRLLTKQELDMGLNPRSLGS